MSSNSKKHHYVPEAHLRNFARADHSEQIWVYDKLRQRHFSSAVRDAASEGNFNTIELDDAKINLEPIFGEVDDFGPPIVRKIIESQRVDQLSQNERVRLTLAVAAQFLRAKIRRLFFVHFMESLGESARNSGWEPEEFANFKIPTEMEAKIMALKSLGSIDKLAREIGSKTCVLHKIDDGGLWISDNPVVLRNSFPYGNGGFSSPGIEIYYPLSPELLLAFYCPSIAWKIQQAVLSRQLTDKQEHFRLILKGMLDGLAVESRAGLGAFNSLQVAQSHRFLFSATEEFSLAETMVREQPDLSQVKGFGSLGPMGEVPRRESMPSGTYLVVIGDFDHIMLPVASRCNDPEDAEFEVIVQAAKIPLGLRAAQSFQTVSIFEDGHEVQMIRGARLEFHEHEENCAVRVRFSDEGMNRLSAVIKGRRG